jgi:hypothetical protein
MNLLYFSLQFRDLSGQLLFTLWFVNKLLKTARLTPTIVLSLRDFAFEQQLRAKEFTEFWCFTKIILLTFLCHLFTCCFWVRPTTIAGLLAVHKANCGQDEASYVPCWSPGLLMVVRKRGTNRQISLKPPRWRVEEEFRCIKRIVFVQFE